MSESASDRVLLLAASVPEVMPTVNRLHLRKQADRWNGEFRGHNISAYVCGIGRFKAINALNQLVGQRRVNRVINLGFAGGLLPEATVGSLVPDQPGALITVDHMIATPEEKQQLGQSQKAMAVDMESAHVRKWCNEHGIACDIVRAISDACDEALPAEAADWIDDRGQPRKGAVIGYLLRRPWRLSSLLKLQKDSALAGETIAKQIEHLLSKP